MPPTWPAPRARPPGTVQDLVVDGAAGPLPARLYRPAWNGPAPVLVYFHGGGWILGDVDSYDPVVRALAAASGVAWVSVGYRRPPEDPFPAAVDDAAAAARWVVANAAGLGVDAGRVGVAGDSAGGQIAAAAAGRLRHAGPARPVLQVLLYPAVDLREAPPPLPDPDGLDFGPSRIDRALRAYLRDTDRTLPEVSPLLDPDPATLPPAVIATAEYDRLRPQAERHAARLRAAGRARHPRPRDRAGPRLPRLGLVHAPPRRRDRRDRRRRPPRPHRHRGSGPSATTAAPTLKPLAHAV
ncbi:alpha/beta hydrolase fold domain-containing protein [Actinomadura madurae]|uniref:alpha/beta hydrolase fold domain-containing protein n=1 Tax=Actinomadura madurae TaxID=1993 RepID=UPI0020D1FBD8|nr:alpha/beta hydrolase fold domain-containing protein [Actinomadura madurae]MCQ0011500.1 alpha/beta hydrolase [Actinomadura madurae]